MPGVNRKKTPILVRADWSARGNPEGTQRELSQMLIVVLVKMIGWYSRGSKMNGIANNVSCLVIPPCTIEQYSLPYTIDMPSLMTQMSWCSCLAHPWVARKDPPSAVPWCRIADSLCLRSSEHSWGVKCHLEWTSMLLLSATGLLGWNRPRLQSKCTGEMVVLWGPV